MSKDLSSWDTCEAEELQTLGRQLRQKERAQASNVATRRLLAGGAVAVLMIFSITGIQGMLTPDSITCSECAAGFVAYAQHLEGTELMASGQAGSMERHLAECPLCLEKFGAKYPGLLPTAVNTAALGFVSLFLIFSNHSSSNQRS